MVYLKANVCVYFTCVCICPLYVHTLMTIDFQGRHIASRQKWLTINKVDSRRITRPFINPQFRRLGICRSCYNKQARHVTPVYCERIYIRMRAWTEVDIARVSPWLHRENLVSGEGRNICCFTFRASLSRDESPK